jgi:hypothetical protein
MDGRLQLLLRRLLSGRYVDDMVCLWVSSDWVVASDATCRAIGNLEIQPGLDSTTNESVIRERFLRDEKFRIEFETISFSCIVRCVRFCACSKFGCFSLFQSEWTSIITGFSPVFFLIFLILIFLFFS